MSVSTEDRPLDRPRAPARPPAPTERRRVLFVINSMAGGGAERVMATLLAASVPQRERADIRLVLLDKEPAAYTPPDWIPTIQLDSRGQLTRSVAGLAGVLRTVRPHATVSFLTRANLCTVVTARWFGHRTVISERVNSSAHFGTGAKAALSKLSLRMSYPRAQAVIAPSAGVAEDLVENFGVAAGRISVIANPVDVAAIRALAECPVAPPVATPYIVSIGRLTANKNFATLIEAYARAAIEPSLVILGQGPLEDTLRRQIAERGLERRVILAGFRENPFALMRGALAYVSASRSEGFPNSLVEAMAVGLPVVSSNCPSGPSEILAEKPRNAVTGLDHAAHGILVPVDDAEALAQALRSLSDSALRERYAQAARARVERYDVAGAMRQYWDVIDAA